MQGPTRSRYLNSTMVPQGVPAGWKSPLRAPLYQVCVEETDGSGSHFVGPAMLKDEVGAFAEAIRRKIKSGDEKQWGNPTVMLVRPGSFAA